ncbi:3,4-dihydroxy-2-butanone-4-phosphate synthase [Pyrofollis japonicus]|uniref:3,4-dihydroxy-2-butanone-4-phosphate synthase n=1 Tax=Pyrofollis japonicus TaxID=3060460 RepID=UPI00295AA935|nr:3,4-dihydroxy-2-butanone-4-phosphate synthase [Pyrofollis japonicus]BEP18495.1 3,4-dihydroxy-2-butanone-4-phosphate synthase [Pyrofollis japonicus]
MNKTIEKAIELFAKGKPVLIHDDYGREDEVDYAIHASAVTADTIYEMRTRAGGLICYVMPLRAGSLIGLRYAYEIYAAFPELAPLTRRTLGYGDKPAFSVWVNSLKAKTGIRDNDRAITIRELHNVLELITKGNISEARKYFVENFVAPGHVPILLGRSLKERKGHSELSLHLAMLAGLSPSAVIVEMLDKGTALSVEKARKVAEELGTVVVEGSEIISEVEKLGEDLYCRYNLCKS